MSNRDQFPADGPPDLRAEDDGRYDSDEGGGSPPVLAELVPMDTTALSALARTEVDAGLVWAKANNRSIAVFLDEMHQFVLRDKETAEKMYYSMRRGGKAITGPSVRMAELAAECYGNLKAASRILSTTGEYAIAEGVAHDLERNTWISRTVARRLTNSKGIRYNDDMIVMTANAAGSLALRNAIVSVVGRRYLDPLVEKARTLVGGGAAGLAQRRAEMLEFWMKKGVSNDRVLAVLGKKGAEDLTPEDLADARGFARAIIDNEATVDEVFPPIDSVIERLRARRAEGLKVGPDVVQSSGRALWTALPALDPVRVETARWVAEMNADNPVRIGLAMKKAKNERSFEAMTVTEVAAFYEAWKTTKVAK